MKRAGGSKLSGTGERPIKALLVPSRSAPVRLVRSSRRRGSGTTRPRRRAGTRRRAEFLLLAAPVPRRDTSNGAN